MHDLDNMFEGTGMEEAEITKTLNPATKKIKDEPTILIQQDQQKVDNLPAPSPAKKRGRKKKVPVFDFKTNDNSNTRGDDYTTVRVHKDFISALKILTDQKKTIVSSVEEAIIFFLNFHQEKLIEKIKRFNPFSK